MVNNIGYLGRRKCYCHIEEDDYLGSGKLLKMAIKKFGKENFKKTILCVCDSDKEMYQKEMEYIEKYNAVYSYNYYNIDFGGKPKLNVELDEFQIRKYEYMKKQIKSNAPESYFFKIDEKGDPVKNISPHVSVAKLIVDEFDKVYVEYRMLYNNDMKKPGVQSRTYCNTDKEYNNLDHGTSDLKKKGYMSIDFNTYNLFQENYKKSIMYIDNTFELAKQLSAPTNSASISVGSTNDVLCKEDKKSKENAIIDYIKEKSKSDSNFKYLNKLYSDYGDCFKITEIFYALTGHASIQEDYLKNKLRCSKKEYEKACDALDYLMSFKDIIDNVKGRKIFLSIAILFCYNLGDIDREDLKKRLHRSYKGIQPIEETNIKKLSDALRQINEYYNHLQSAKKKIDIEKEFRRNKYK